MARLLLDHGADVDAVDNDGVTALLAASQQGLTATILTLLDRGATADQAMSDGVTP